MDPSSKIWKKMSGDDEQCIEDRISNLPPELIGKILSLLSTKQAVETCVLSSQWKWFWTFITRLKLHDPSAEYRKPSFIRFMYRLLLHLKTSALNYFSVACYDDISHLREWVSATLLVNVKVLDLRIDVMGATHVLPSDLFTSKKLVKLKLWGSFKIDVPATVCLPRLEVLNLIGVGFRDEDSIKRLFIGCPALDELRVDDCNPRILPQEPFSCRNLTNLLLIKCRFMNMPKSVSLPSLQVLSLDDVIFPDDDSAKRLLCGCPSLQKLKIGIKHLKVLHVAAPMLSNLIVVSPLRGGSVCSKIVLETPSLRYLKVIGLSLDSCELTDLNQLVEAYIGGMHHYKGYEVVSNLIIGVSNVKTLYLCGSVVEGIVKGGCELPKFHNLTTLKLGGVSKAVGWSLLPDLLENSPFLETLVFDDGLGHSKNAAWNAPQRVPHCVLHHLKVIQIHYSMRDVVREEMIQYFVENSKGLVLRNE